MPASSTSSGLSGPPPPVLAAAGPGRALVPVEQPGTVPERLVFGKPWIDNSGLTFERNDMFEIYAHRPVGRLNHVFSIESVPVLVNAAADRRVAEILGFVPEALNYVPSLTVGQAFPMPMRTRRPPEPPLRRVQEALAAARVLASRASGSMTVSLLELLADSDGDIDREGLLARLRGVPEDQARMVLEELRLLREVVLGHAAILHAASFKRLWDQVASRVRELDADFDVRHRAFNSVLSYSVAFLRDIVAGPSERIVARLDEAHTALREGLREGRLAELPERQFAIWRECRRLAVFFDPLVSLWDLVEFNAESRSNLEALVRSTTCRLQSFR